MGRGLPLTSCLDSCLTSIREMLVIFTGASAKYLPGMDTWSYSVQRALMQLLNLSGNPALWFPLQRNFFFYPRLLFLSCYQLYQLLLSNFFLRKKLHEDFILFTNCYSPTNLRPVNRCLNIQFFVATFVLKSSRIRNNKNANLGAYN